METRIITAAAPLRVDFAGGFTDVPPFCEMEGGFVVNAAITIKTTVTVAKCGRGASGSISQFDASGGQRFFDMKYSGAQDGIPGEIAPFIIAMGARRARRMKMQITSGGPPSSGLGSSGSALVAALAAVRGLFHLTIDARAIARRARAIEVEELQQIGGGQDPLASALGGVLGIDFSRGGRDGDPAKMNISESLQKALEQSVILVNLNNPRSSSSKIAHVVKKIQKRHKPTLAILREMAKSARALGAELRRESIEGALAAIDEHAGILCKLDSCIYANGVAEAIAAAKAAGARSGKPCGAGGGGCVAIFTDKSRRERVASALRDRNYLILPFAISREGVQVEENIKRPIPVIQK